MSSISRPAHERIALDMLHADGWTDDDLATLGDPPDPRRLAAALRVPLATLTAGSTWDYELATGAQSYPPPVLR